MRAELEVTVDGLEPDTTTVNNDINRSNDIHKGTA